MSTMYTIPIFIHMAFCSRQFPVRQFVGAIWVLLISMTPVDHRLHNADLFPLSGEPCFQETMSKTVQGRVVFSTVTTPSCDLLRWHPPHGVLLIKCDTEFVLCFVVIVIYFLLIHVKHSPTPVSSYDWSNASEVILWPISNSAQIGVSVTPLYGITSPQNCAHTTTAQLPCQVPNYIAIILL